jgi:polyisoprenoid-binding protein YceI
MTQSPSTSAAGVRVGRWTIDPSHSLVEFSARHMMVTNVKGRFTGITGVIVWDEGDLARSTVEVDIDASSIDTRDERRDTHLRSPDFFEVEKYPTLVFKSTRVVPKGAEEAEVHGNLTIKGVTREVALDTELNGVGKNPYGKTVAGFTATTTVNRKDFGLEWNVALETGGFLVGDTIKVTLEIEAVLQEG